MKRYAEAEDPLREAYAIIVHLDPEGRGIKQAVRSFVTIYEQTGRPRQAAEWRARLPAETTARG